MFNYKSLEKGPITLEYPDVPDFPGICPVSCGADIIRCGSAVISSSSNSILLYIVEGEGTVSLLDNNKKYGTGCLICAKKAQDLVIETNSVTSYLYLILRGAGSYIESIGFFKQLGRDNTTLQGLTNFCFHAQEGGLGNLYSASASVYELIMDILAYCEKHGAEYSELVHNAIDVMHRNFAFIEGIDDLAERSGVSKCHLIRKFSNETGISPGKYLQDVRLEQAKLLLLSRDYSISDVAGMVGYSSANYFCKAFSKSVGQTPGQYRNSHESVYKLDQQQLHQMEQIENQYL